MSAPETQQVEPRLVRNLPVSEIKTDGKNLNGRVDGPAFDEFCEDVKQHGVLQAILVRALPGKGRSEGAYHLIAGHRRLAASKRAGYEEIPAVISTAGPEQDEELRLVENLHRQDLHPLDEADGYKKLLDGKGQTVASVAQRVGRSARYVYDRLRFDQLTPDAKRLFRIGKIEAGHAVILARLSPAVQKKALDPIGNALFQNENPLFDSLRDEGVGRAPASSPWDDVKAVTANELQAWVDDNVRMEPKDVDPMLFPVTAEELAAAGKVIPITRGLLLKDSAKSKERTFGSQSWKRADGKLKSKTCTYAVLGMVVAGDGRGEAFKVCVAKDKCTVHYAGRVKQQAKKAAAKSKRLAKGGDPKAAAAKEAEREKRDEAKDRARQKANDIARRLIYEATLEAASKLSLLDLVRAWLGTSGDETACRKYLAKEVVDADWQGTFAKKMGVNVKAIQAKAEAEELAKLEPKKAAPAKAAKSAKPPKGQRPRKRGVAKKGAGRG